MFLLMSRYACHSRGDFAVDFRSPHREACEIAMDDATRADRGNGFPARERIVVEIVARIDPTEAVF